MFTHIYIYTTYVIHLLWVAGAKPTRVLSLPPCRAAGRIFWNTYTAKSPPP